MAYHPNQIARILVKTAMNRETLTYTDLGRALGRTGPTPGLGLGSHLDKCQEWLKKHSLPPLTLLVVTKQSGRPSDEGTFFGRKFAEMSGDEISALQEKCFSYSWSASQLKALGL